MGLTQQWTRVDDLVSPSNPLQPGQTLSRLNQQYPINFKLQSYYGNVQTYNVNAGAQPRVGSMHIQKDYYHYWIVNHNVDGSVPWTNANLYFLFAGF